MAHEWINTNPVCLLKVKRNKVDVGFLNEEDIKAIQKINLPANLSISREIFLFAVYTGVAYTDMTKLTNENITIGIDHTPWLNYRRQKTGARVALPLLEPAQQIIKEFDCYNTHKPNSRLFPLICKDVYKRQGHAVLAQYSTSHHLRQTCCLDDARHVGMYLHLPLFLLLRIIQKRMRKLPLSPFSREQRLVSPRLQKKTEHTLSGKNKYRYSK